MMMSTIRLGHCPDEAIAEGSFHDICLEQICRREAIF
jgi:hypothetical protein